MSAASAPELAAGVLAQLRRRRFDSSRHLYGRRWLGRWQYVSLWPHASAWAASVAVGALEPALLEAPGDACAAALRYHAADHPVAPGGLDSAVAPPLGRGGERYYDDNAWIGLVALRHDRLVADARLVELARGVAEFVESGWSTRPDLVEPGGIHWKETAEPRGRNTCANAPGAALFASLGLRGDAAAGERAVRVYAWTRRTLRTKAGLYVDQIAPDGRRDGTLWSYNQGAMIGAGVLLSALTGEQRYADDARETAAAALARYTSAGLLAAEPAPFAAVFFRNVFLLEGGGPDSPAGDLARAWVAAVSSRIGADGLVHARDEVNATAALAEVSALLAGAPPGP